MSKWANLHGTGPIGSTFTHQGMSLKVTEDPNDHSVCPCDELCAFSDKICSDMNCAGDERMDGKPVYYVGVELDD